MPANRRKPVGVIYLFNRIRAVVDPEEDDMRRIGYLVVTLAAPLLVVGCRAAAPPSEPQPPNGVSATPQVPTERDELWPDAGPVGVLGAISTQHLVDHDRIVFQFHGPTPPEATISYPTRITEDPSDKPVPLLGNAFIAVVFHGGRLDTAATEADPSGVVRYGGPTRLTPRYPLLQDLAVAGNFEAVLSFGLGLSAVAEARTSTPEGTGSVILDLWPAADTNT
jgi:hypothetical protein